MHVAINAHLLSFSPSYRGAGITRYISSLTRYLRQAGEERFTVFLGDPNYPPELGPRASFELRVSRLPTVRPNVRILWEQLLLPIELLRSDVDVLHSTGYVQPMACPRRSVVTVHDLSFVLFPRAFNRLNRLYLTLFTRASVRRADRVIAVSQNTKNDLIRIWGVPSEKIEVVYHGVEDIFRPIAMANTVGAHGRAPLHETPLSPQSSRRDLDLPERYILFIGTLEPRKNVHTLIRAFASLKKTGLPHKLVVGGAKGWLFDEVFAVVAQLGLETEVIFPGYIALEDQPLWYNGADLFVYPSLYEGFGFPPLEAMACGTPVITSNCSSLPEVVGEAGLSVDPTDSGQLAEAMIAVLTDRALSEKMRRMGIERAGSFSWAAAARKTMQVYRSCSYSSHLKEA